MDYSDVKLNISINKENFDYNTEIKVNLKKNSFEEKLLEISKSIKKMNVSSKSIIKKQLICPKNYYIDNNKILIKRNDFYYIAKYYSNYEVKNLIQDYSLIFEKIFNKEIEFLKINKFSDNEIKNIIYTGSIQSTCNELLKKTPCFTRILESFPKKNNGYRSFSFTETSISFKKFHIRSLLISMIVKIGENHNQAHSFTIEDAKQRKHHFIAFGDYQNELQMAVWSGKILGNDLSDEFYVAEGDYFLIQRIYDLTQKKFLILKNLKPNVQYYDLLVQDLIDSKILLNNISKNINDPIIAEGICPILADIQENQLKAVIYPMMEGDSTDFIYKLEEDINGLENVKLSDYKLDFMREMYRLILLLEEIHTQKIHYGDFKPENILYKIVDGKLRFYLADWDGIIDYTGEKAKKNYENGLFPGSLTPEYICKNDVESFHRFCMKSKQLKDLDQETLESHLELKIVYSFGLTVWNLISNFQPIPTTEDFIHSNNSVLNQLKQEWPQDFLSLIFCSLGNKSDRFDFNYLIRGFEKSIKSLLKVNY